ncbi:hypothetical protein [Ectothiorhodospira sp. PHS-1]|uniref:hypothetical protein n=1 Tax=Ectothiorhodospira sp. PHS-1 TaxID=519989 RepID=UPI00143B7AFD|nr:hypothetical protein [Ectothiorhodospira sp. PHS-1]
MMIRKTAKIPITIEKLGLENGMDAPVICSQCLALVLPASDGAHGVGRGLLSGHAGKTRTVKALETSAAPTPLCGYFRLTPKHGGE